MCDRGYMLALDGQTCMERDECDIVEYKCDQLCVKEQGKGVCRCRIGYIRNHHTDTCQGMEIVLLLFLNYYVIFK